MQLDDVKHSFRNINWSREGLTCCMIAGLLFGCSYAGSVDASVYAGVLSTPGLTFSFAGFLTVLFLPFLFTAFAVFIKQQWLLYPICFVKFFAFGFCSFLILSVFSPAGWLVRFFLLFSDSLLLPVLVWIWFNAVENGKEKGEFLIYSAAAVLTIGSLDYFGIAPYLSGLWK